MVTEVHLIHPRFAWFGELGLRWYAVPVICDMCLEIGGICYPAAPFNGWYMGTGIGARNLADPGRYNQLPEIAARMGLDTTRDRSTRRDQARPGATRRDQARPPACSTGTTRARNYGRLTPGITGNSRPPRCRRRAKPARNM